MSDLDDVRGLLADDRLRAAMLELDRATFARDLDDLGREATSLAERAARLHDDLVAGRAARETFDVEWARLREAMTELVGRVDAAARDERRVDGAPGPTGPALELSRARKVYPGGTTIGPVDVVLERGSVLAVVGPNGGGKTTILRLIAGLLALDGGERRVTSTDAAGRVLLHPLAHVPETPPRWTGTMLAHLEWQAALHGVTRPSENARFVRHIAHQLDVWNDRHKRYAELSDGARMRVALAAALLVDPAILVLDEPLGPLDPISQDALLTWMRGWADDRGTAFVVSTHHVAIVEAVADRVLLVRPGEPPACLDDAPQRPAARTLRVVLQRHAERDELRRRLVVLRDAGKLRGFVESASGFVVLVPGDADPFVWAGDLGGDAIASIEDCSRSALQAIMTPRP